MESQCCKETHDAAWYPCSDDGKRVVLGWGRGLGDVQSALRAYEFPFFDQASQLLGMESMSLEVPYANVPGSLDEIEDGIAWTSGFP